MSHLLVLGNHGGTIAHSAFDPGGYTGGLNFDIAGAMGYSSQLGSQPVLQSTDLNSPEVFKQNIQLAQGHIARVQSLARNGRTCKNVSNASRRSAPVLKADEHLRSQKRIPPGYKPHANCRCVL